MPYPQDLFIKYRNKGILVDTNLLLLLVVGHYDSERIPRFPRTNQFTSEDFRLVQTIVNFFLTRITTPNILTEVDNLIRQAVPRNEHQAMSTIMQTIINTQFEIHIPSANVASNPLYGALGLADCATLMCPPDRLVLTDDFPLSNRLSHVGRDVLNINHIRKFDI
jgi:hypothetical protein